MPFYYYGSKSKISRYYPAPKYNTIIEPFAGSGAYSLHFASEDTRVILIEKNIRLAALWRRIQKMSVDEIMSIPVPVKGDITSEPLVIAAGRGRQFSQSWCGGVDSIQVTEWMADGFITLKKRIAKHLPLIQNWEIIEGHAGLVAPDIEATWFIDPPYWVSRHANSNGGAYANGSSDIDFERLGDWCRSRQGQVIVCEQLGAQWLPFSFLREIHTQASATLRNATEVMWTNE